MLSLGEWTPHIQTRFPEPDSTRGHSRLLTTGLSPSLVRHSIRFAHIDGLSAFARRYLRSRVAFLSCGYLDVSVPHVRFLHLCIQCKIPFRVGCPIRKSQDHSSVTNSSGLIAGSCVLHRLLTPRHPPCALDGRPSIACRARFASRTPPTGASFKEPIRSAAHHGQTV